MYKNVLAAIWIFLFIFAVVQNMMKSPDVKKTGDLSANMSGQSIIPEWVFVNSSSQDNYYGLVTGSKNKIVFIYPDSSTGQFRREEIDKSVKAARASNDFDVFVNLYPANTEKKVNCHKIFEEIPYPSEEYDQIVHERQGDIEDNIITDIGDGRYCIPVIKDGQLPEGACKCVENYILENCSDEVCIINPTTKEIVKVYAGRKYLVKTLKTLKKIWKS